MPRRELRGTKYRWIDPEGVTHDVVYDPNAAEHVLLCVEFQPFGFCRSCRVDCNVTCLACIVLEKDQYLK